MLQYIIIYGSFRSHVKKILILLNCRILLAASLPPANTVEDYYSYDTRTAINNYRSHSLTRSPQTTRNVNISSGAVQTHPSYTYLVSHRLFFKSVCGKENNSLACRRVMYTHRVVDYFSVVAPFFTQSTFKRFPIIERFYFSRVVWME